MEEEARQQALKGIFSEQERERKGSTSAKFTRSFTRRSAPNWALYGAA